MKEKRNELIYAILVLDAELESTFENNEDKSERIQELLDELLAVQYEFTEDEVMLKRDYLEVIEHANHYINFMKKNYHKIKSKYYLICDDDKDLSCDDALEIYTTFRERLDDYLYATSYENDWNFDYEILQNIGAEEKKYFVVRMKFKGEMEKYYSFTFEEVEE